MRCAGFLSPIYGDSVVAWLRELLEMWRLLKVVRGDIQMRASAEHAFRAKILDEEWREARRRMGSGYEIGPDGIVRRAQS
jgi:hypothetical protein